MERRNQAAGSRFSGTLQSSASHASNRGPHHVSDPVEALKGRDAELPSLTKAALADLLSERVGLNKRESKDMVEAFFDEIVDALERGELVKLTGFGSFQL